MREAQLHAFIAKKVRLAMQAAHVNQAELCRKSGVPRATMSSQLTTPNFTLEVLWKIAPVLGRDLRWFFPGEPEEHVAPARMAEVVRRVVDAVEYGKGADGMKRRKRSG